MRDLDTMTLAEFQKLLITSAVHTLHSIMGDKFLEMSDDEQSDLVHDLIMALAQEYIDNGFKNILKTDTLIKGGA